MFDLWFDMFGIALVTGSALIYYFSKSTFGIWRRKNIVYVRPTLLFGNTLPVALGSEHPIDVYQKIYDQLQGHKFGGMFQMRTPYLMIRDPQLIVSVLRKNFDCFISRGQYSDLKTNKLSNHLFFMSPSKWKIMRKKLSPAFTSGKLRHMHKQMRECAGRLMKQFDDRLMESSADHVEVREIFRDYSTDVISTCAYGVTMDCTPEFRRFGKKVFEPSLRVLFRELCLLISPNLLKIVRIADMPPKVTAFFGTVLTDVMSSRDANDIVREDLLQFLIKAKKDLVSNRGSSDKCDGNI